MNTRPDKPSAILVVDPPPINSVHIHHEVTEEDLHHDITKEDDSDTPPSSPKPESTTQREALPFIMAPTLSQALNVSEITHLIRQELRGVDLKRCVLVHSSWWKCFAPYLWERIFIESYPGESDQGVIFRNGLAVRSLTLSISDEEGLHAMKGKGANGYNQGLIAYVADRCRNVTTLDLKLFSSLLAIKKETLNHASKLAQDQEEGEEEEGEEEEEEVKDYKEVVAFHSPPQS